MKLNSRQEEAVKYQKGPLLIIAGAGTGKTTVITERIKWLITEKKLSPSQILALTFTEKAAKEMEARVDQALPLGYSQLWISTFHSFCDQILRDEASHIGLNPNFKLMSEAETILFLRKHLFDFDFKYFRPVSNPDKFLGGIINHFSRLADEDISPGQYLEFAKKMAKGAKEKEEILEAEKTMELAQAFVFYQQLKEKGGFFDFADLITYCLKLFRERVNVLKEYQKKFELVLIDEFQDTNIAQNELALLLAGDDKNITVVCDDDQSIYKWRGAAVSNVLQFKENFPKAKLVVLTKNYRSTQTILDQAYQLIKHNNPDRLEVKEKIDKKLTPSRKAKEEPIKLILADRVENEADLVVQEIKKLTKAEYQFKEIAILVRANNHSLPFTQALARSGIPYQFLGPGHLFRKPEIKDLIAYLKILIDLQDDIAFFKVASIDVFQISARELAFLRSKAKKNNLSFFEAAERETRNEKMAKLIEMIRRHLKLLAKETGGQILYYFLEDSGLLKSLLEPKTEADHQKALNLAKFFDKVKQFETDNENASVFHLLDWITLRLELGEGPLVTETDWTEANAVNILTAHSAKGLEFPVVFLVNLVDQRFPTRRRSEPIPIPQPLIKEFLPQGDPHEQEERRLFYVAMTRAKDRLYFSAAKYYGDAKREKKISPFIIEALGEKKLDQLVKGKRLEESQLSLLAWQKPEEKEEPATFNFPVNYLSFSQLDSFEICPLQYKYKYLIRLPIPPSPAQTMGIVLHRTLKEFYQKQATSKEKLSQKEIEKTFEENWSSSGFKTKGHEKEAKEGAKKMLVNYYQKEIKNKSLPKIAALEQPFSFPLAPELRVGGIIDRADILDDNKIEIIDYKTGGRVPDQKAADGNDQLTLYALAASTITDFKFNRPVEKIILSLYFLNEGIKVSSQRNRKQLQELKEKIIKTAKEIEKTSFPPRPGTPFPCNFCEFKLLCQAWE